MQTAKSFKLGICILASRAKKVIFGVNYSKNHLFGSVSKNMRPQLERSGIFLIYAIFDDLIKFFFMCHLNIDVVKSFQNQQNDQLCLGLFD